MINSKTNVLYILLLSLLVSSCELMGPDLHKKLPLKKVEQIDQVEQPGVIYQELSNDFSGNDGLDEPKIELYPGTGQFISEKMYSDSSEKELGKGEYSLNFDDANLAEVIKVILSDILSKNYVLSPKVTGKVTLQTTRPLTKIELLPTLEMLLQLNNAAIVYNHGLYRIKPAAEALVGSSFNPYSKINTSGYQVRVVPVKNVAVEELSEILKPLLKDKTILHTDSSRNMMLIAGTANELARALEMVNTFDIDVMKGRSFGLFPLKNVDAAKIIEELEQIFNKKNAKSGSSFNQFIEIERLNSILAITHQSTFLQEIERWVLRLDRANTSAGGGAIVYRVQHVDAVELAATLNEIFSGSHTKKDKPASIAPGRKAIKVTNKKRAEKSKTKSQPNANRKLSVATGITDLGDIKIIADEVNNALIIVATAQDYAVVQKVIKQLDVMPLQVLIDATIVEVTLADNLQYGIQWFLSHKTDHWKGAGVSRGGGLDLAETASNLAVGAATGGFGYAFISNSGDIRAVLDASANADKLNVISSPSLMVLNNQEANIRVGDEVPIRTTESTNTNSGTGDGANPIQTSSIQQRQTGVKLKVKPRVNANGLVIMEIEQSVENVALRSASGSNIDSPTIATREINSTVAVQSGETIVLGGLIKNDDTFNIGGIPFLHELPLIGPLFGTTIKDNIRTELVVLITPRVVKTRQDARLITNEFKRKLSGIYKEVSEVEVEQEEKMAATE